MAGLSSTGLPRLVFVLLYCHTVLHYGWMSTVLYHTLRRGHLLRFLSKKLLFTAALVGLNNAESYSAVLHSEVKYNEGR